MAEIEKNDTKKEVKTNKIGFFKKALISIKDFDKYNIFADERIGQTLLYFVEMIAILSLVLSISLEFKTSQVIGDAINQYNEKISTLTYQNSELSINDNQKIEIDNLGSYIGKIIIDTSDLSDEQIDEYTQNLANYDNAVLILKDRFLIKNPNLASITGSKYSDVVKIDSTEAKNKEDILNDFYSNKMNIYSSLLLMMFIGIFIVYLTNVLVDAIILGFLGFITAKIARMPLKYDAGFNIAVHALTLPLILNIIYATINTFTGFTIKYFQVMYTGIAYIYIITAIFMMKSDYIKKQIDLQKIEDEQQKVKEEMEEKELEKKEEEEKRKVKDRDKKRENKKDKKENNNDEENPSVGDKPAGSNV